MVSKRKRRKMIIQFTDSCRLYARRFPRSHWSFLEPGAEEKWYGTCTNRPDGSWNQLSEKWWEISQDPVIQYSPLSSAFERGELRSKGGGKKSINFNGSNENIELLLRTVISSNQLSIYGAVADLCNEAPEDFRALGKPAALDHLEKMEILTGLSMGENSTSAQQRGNLLQAYERKFEQLSEDHKLSKLCSDAGLKFVEQGHFFYTLETEEGQQMQHLCREYTMPRNEKEDSCEMMDSQEYENRPSLEHESLPSWRSIQYWSSCPVSVPRQNRFLG